jgi:FAD-linked oxidoreductase
MQRRDILQALGLTVMSGSASPRANASESVSEKNSGWQNWSRSLPSSTDNIATPQDLDALKKLLATTKGAVRPVGAGHSWMPLVPADGAIVRLDHFNAIGEIDRKSNRAWLGAGGKLKDLSPLLAEQNLAFRNLGDIDVQSLAGATSTATHGTGKNLPCLAAEITGLKLLTAAGEMMQIDARENNALLPAAQVALGALGLLTEIEMQLVPRHKLHRRVQFLPYQQVLESAHDAWHSHRNFEFMYIPFSGTALTITHDETQSPDTPRAADESDDGVMQLKALRDWMGWFPALRKRLLGWAISNAPEENVIGESWQLLTSARNVHFNEMEYHLPVDSGLEVLEEIRRLIEREHADVFFPIECRMTAGDDAWLSPFNDGPRLSVAVHTHAPDEYEFLFSKIEPIFRRAGGRPHWGKLNSVSGDEVRGLYPRFEDFAKLRAELDPQGRFLNPYLTALFGEG